ncbi:RNA polymerase sigma factor [Streptomyces virginiae]|uniref:RNA polymerase sigma factor n=1 Tax=Streptomyces virginiae TaxID=1961 RepID=UPI0037BBCEDE
MLNNKSHQCLGSCQEGVETQPAFHHRDNDAERPKRVYEDRAWWCTACWRDGKSGAYDRFHALYEPRLQRYVARKVRAFFPPHMRSDAREEVTAETLREIWEKWERLVTPERVMYKIAYREMLRRIPKQDRPLMVPHSELVEILPDENDTLANVEEQMLLEELVAELPAQQREYVRRRLEGATIDEIADQAGRSKATVSEGLKRATDAMRQSAREAIQYVNLAVSIVTLIKWVVPALLALLALLLG